MAVDVRGRSIRITYQIDKKRIRVKWPEPYSTAAIKNAERVQSRIRRDIQDGVFTEISDYLPQIEAPNTKTFGEFAQEWLDRDCTAGKDVRAEYVYTLNRVWLPILGDKQVRHLTPSIISDAIHEGLKEVNKPGSRNVYKVPLRMILRSAARLELTEKDLSLWVESEKREKPQPDPFTLDEARQIISTVDSYRNYFRFAFFSGLRIGETLSLLWEDVDLEGSVYVHRSLTNGTVKGKTKTDAPRTVYLNKESMAALKAQRAVTQLQGGLVFCRPGQRHYREETLRAVLDRAVSKLGIRRRTLRSTRHTYATILLNEGVDLNFIAKQMGHSVDVLLRHYAKWINDEDRVKREMAKVEGVL